MISIKSAQIIFNNLVLEYYYDIDIHKTGSMEGKHYNQGKCHVVLCTNGDKLQIYDLLVNIDLTTQPRPTVTLMQY